MAIALGRGDDANAVYIPEMSGTTMNHSYDRLDGVSFEWEGLVDPLTDGLPKEQLYGLDSDVHLLLNVREEDAARRSSRRAIPPSSAASWFRARSP